MITQNIHVRMDAYGIPPVIHAVEGDTWRYLDIYTDDAAINTSNTAAVAIHRPDNSYYTISATPDVGGFYHLEMDQALTRPGKVECQLKVSSGDLVISTYTFYVIVEPSTTGLPTEQLGYDIYDLIEAAETITPSPGLTDDIKQALLTCFEHVAWTDEHGQDYVDALEAALYPPAELASISAVYTQSGTVYETDTLDSLRDDLVVTAYYDDSSSEVVTTYTLSGTLVGGTSTITVSYGGKTTTFTVNVYQPAELVSISAVYTQSGTVYDTDTLDSLKSDLVVTALYDDQTTATVTNYTLSGTLTEGTSTITVSYGGKTTTFTVTVSEYVATPLYNWDLTSSLTDTVGGITASTTATFTQGTGLVFNANGKYCDFGAVYALDRTYELDVVSHVANDLGQYGRIFMVDTDADTGSGGSGFIFTGSKKATTHPTGYGIFTGTNWDSQTFAGIGTGTMNNRYNDGFFNGKTLKFYMSSDGKCSVSYKTIDADDSTYVLLGTSVDAFNSYTNGHVYIGGSQDFVRNATFSGFRVYEGEV